MTLVFMFPGQSSRYLEMLERIISAWAPAGKIVDHSSDILGRDIQAHYSSENPRPFERNRDIQVGVFLTSYLHQMALADLGIVGDLSLGLSLGEYNHLVHIGALDFENALRLVEARGKFYDKGPKGLMASVFPLPLDELERYVEEVRDIGVVEIANLNSPSQNVIAGERKAVEAAIKLIEEEELGAQAVIIERRIPMHTSLFRPVSVALRPELERVRWRRPERPYIPNVLATLLEMPEQNEIVELLVRHVYQPVLWRRSIDLLAERHEDACFIEVGPGSVLYNLLQRRWRGNRKFRTDSLDDLAGHLSRNVCGFVDAI